MSDSSNPDAPAPPRRSLFGRLLRVAVVLLILVGALVALLPTLLSSDSITNRAVGQTNEALAGTVVLEDLELSWSGEQSLHGLTLWPAAEGEGEALFRLPNALFRLAILSAVQGRYDILAEVDGFDARLVLHEDGSTNIDDFLGTDPSGGTDSTEPGDDEPSTDGGGGLDLPPLIADITLRGRAEVVDEALGVTNGVENLVLTILSRTEADPVDLDITADIRIEDNLAPFEFHVRALAPDQPGASFKLTSSGLQPGAMGGPLLAAAFPLLAGDGTGQPPKIDAPLSLGVDLSTADLASLMNGDLAGLSGTIDVELGDGEISGTVLSLVRGAFDKLGADQTGLDLGALAGQLDATRLQGLERLEFRGLRSTLRLDGGKASIVQAEVQDGTGETRPLPIEGHMDLTTRELDYRIPWTALIPDSEAASLLADRALRITGPVDAPRIELDLKGLIQGALSNAVQDQLDQASAEVDEALAEKLDGEVADKLDALLGEGKADDVKDKVDGLFGGLFGGDKDKDDGDGEQR